MKNLQKGFIGLVITVIASMLLAGGGVYLYLNKNKSTIPTARQKGDEAALKVNTINAKALQDITSIVSEVANFRAVAEIYYSNHSESYSGLCKNGLIDATSDKNASRAVTYILSSQGVLDQSNAGIVCVATKDKYALEVTFKKYVPPNGSDFSGKYSYCVDSSGVGGYDTKYKIDQANFKCKSLQ